MNPLPHTPTVEELLPDHRVKCSEPLCDSVFTNNGNYELHLQKRHCKQLIKEDRQLLYHCPQNGCNYNVTSGKHFKNMKYLRQHYQKVHSAKVHICSNCSKGFATVGHLSAHKEKVCGKKFICRECGWNYGTIEALLTHGRRKGHVVRKEQGIGEQEVEEVAVKTVKQNAVVKRCKPQKRVLKTKLKLQDQGTQTVDEAVSKRLCMMGVQTDFPFSSSILDVTGPCNSHTADLDDINSILRHIETQTEVSLRSSPLTSCGGSTNATNSLFVDQMLAPPPTDMHTQTCDDFLTELGLTDIQTQTNWSSFSPPPTDRQQYASIATSTGCAYDELLVSTETQTSFTQCLLDSCHTTSGPSASGADGAFGCLYATQHTQTCDTLLEGLFGVPENDLIAGLHSTYTQT